MADLRKPHEAGDSFILYGLECKVREYVGALYTKRKIEICAELDKDAEQSIRKLLKELKATIESEHVVDRLEYRSILKVFFNNEEIK